MDGDSSRLTAYVGYGDSGISLAAYFDGGFFYNTNSSGYAHLGEGDLGIDARGDGRSGRILQGFKQRHLRLRGNRYLQVNGSGSVAFVQNHPEHADEVIVYNAPEGDEVATYTRGTARLVGGEAGVPLGGARSVGDQPRHRPDRPPDAGGEMVQPLCREKGRETLVVRSSDGGDCAFDYIVYGLRIGFEETTMVQEKQQEALVPKSMKDRRETGSPLTRSSPATRRRRVSPASARRWVHERPSTTAAPRRWSPPHEFDPRSTRSRACCHRAREPPKPPEKEPR